MDYGYRKRKHRHACCCAVVFLLILLVFAVLLYIRKQIEARERQSAESTSAEQSRAEYSRPESPRGEQDAPVPDGGTPNAALCDMIIQAATDGSWQFDFDPDMLQCENAEEISKTVSATFYAMWEEHPEMFYVDCSCFTLPAADENGNYYEMASVELQPLEEYKNQPVLEWYAETKQTAENIIAQIPAGSSDADKALFVHDYLVSHTVYDLDELLSPEVGTGSTVYGALVEHEAVCAGYSSAFMYLMQLMDIPCRYYAGEGLQDSTEQLPFPEDVSNRHSWNCVWLDGEPYWVDVTWDDPLDYNGDDAGGPVRHEYCFLDDETLLRDHIFDSSYADLPVCTDRTLHERVIAADAAAGIVY